MGKCEICTKKHFCTKGQFCTKTFLYKNTFARVKVFKVIFIQFFLLSNFKFFIYIFIITVTPNPYLRSVIFFLSFGFFNNLFLFFYSSFNIYLIFFHHCYHEALPLVNRFFLIFCFFCNLFINFCCFLFYFIYFICSLAKINPFCKNNSSCINVFVKNEPFVQKFSYVEKCLR